MAILATVSETSDFYALIIFSPNLALELHYSVITITTVISGDLLPLMIDDC